MATLYVSNSTANGYALGDNENSGLTKLLPKLTINGARDAASNGDTIIINDGDYTHESSYFNINKPLIILPENAGAVRLMALSGTVVINLSNTTGLVKFGAVEIVGNSFGTGLVTRANMTETTSETIFEGTIFNGGSATMGFLSDSLRHGAVRMKNVVFKGYAKNNAYFGTASASETADKTLEIDGVTIDNLSVGAAFTLMSVSRATSPAGALNVQIHDVNGEIISGTGATDYVKGIIVSGGTDVDVYGNNITITKNAATSTASSVGIAVYSTNAAAPIVDGNVYGNTVNFMAPTGDAITVGPDGSTGYATSLVAYDNTINGKFYPVATPHGLGVRGSGSGVSAYRNTIRDIYVGIIHSLCNGAKAFNNITDGCYGVDLYAKGCGASSAPVFANNTMIKHNRVGDMRSDLACMAANVQGATVNTDTLFVNNRVVLVDMTAKMSMVAPSQGATFEHNGYPKASALASDSFNWQGTSQDFATWKAAHEADAAQEFARITVTTDGKLSAGSRLCHSAKAVTGVTDSSEEDPFGNEFPTYPNIGADQFDYAPGFGPWSTCNAPLPLSAQPCKGHTLPIGTGKVTVFPGVATSSQIEEAVKVTETQPAPIGDIDQFIATGIGNVTITLEMIYARTSLPINTKYYPLGNQFISFENTGTTGRFTVSTESSSATYDRNWVIGELITLKIDSDGYDMIVGEE